MEEFMLEIPSAIENLQLPDPNLWNIYRLLEKRIIYITGQIDESLLEYSKFIQFINMQDAGVPVEKRKPIKIFVFSQGGMDEPTWNIVDIMAISKTPVWTINAGAAMSNGLTILVAGHKRYTMPHAVAMYHSGSAGISGTKEQVDAAGKYIANQDKIYEQWFVDKTKMDVKLFNRKKKTDWYMTAEEMVTNGIVDAIVDDIDILM